MRKKEKQDSYPKKRGILNKQLFSVCNQTLLCPLYDTSSVIDVQSRNLSLHALRLILLVRIGMNRG